MSENIYSGIYCPTCKNKNVILISNPLENTNIITCNKCDNPSLYKNIPIQLIVCGTISIILLIIGILIYYSYILELKF